MGVHHTLRQASRPAGVHDEHQVVTGRAGFRLVDTRRRHPVVVRHGTGDRRAASHRALPAVVVDWDLLLVDKWDAILVQRGGYAPFTL